MTAISWDASTDEVTVGRGSPQATNTDSNDGRLRIAEHSNSNSVHLTADPSNIMTSGRNHGMPALAADWNDDTVIEYNGTTLTAGVAASIGLLTKDANGFRPLGEGGDGAEGAAAKPNTAADDGEEQDSDTPAIERLDDVAENIMTDMVQKVPATELHVAMDAILDGDLSDSLIGTVASNMGILPDQRALKPNTSRPPSKLRLSTLWRGLASLTVPSSSSGYPKRPRRPTRMRRGNTSCTAPPTITMGM